MEPARNTTLRSVITLVCLLTCALLMAPDAAMAQAASISPARLNLTSEGLAETIQAIIHMPIEEGYTLSDFDIQLMFGDVWLADAYSFTYCDYDKAFIASFDKKTVIDNPALLGAVGDRIRLTVEGKYLAVNTDGGAVEYPFSYFGYIWIMAPGK